VCVCVRPTTLQHGVTLALTYGYYLRRVVVIDPQPMKWVWGDRERCGERTLSCWLEPITTCDATIVGQHAVPEFRLKARTDEAYKAEHAEFDWHAAHSHRRYLGDERSLFVKQQVWNRGNKYVPPKYEQHGLFWWRSQLLAYVLRPNAATRAAIDDTRRELQLPTGADGGGAMSVGVHVRRGAKWTETEEVDVHTYVHAVRDVVAAAAAARDVVVFLATDDAGVVRAMGEQFGDGDGEPRYRLAYVRDTYRHDAQRAGRNVTWMDEIQRRWRSAAKDAVDVVRDVWLLSECDYFVGTFSSNIGRVVAELMYAATNVDPIATRRAVSVDKPWVTDP